MAITAVCPYCRQGKVRAPAEAEGLSATCPRCASSFTIVDSAELSRPERPFRREPAPAAAAVAPPAPVETSAPATTTGGPVMPAPAGAEVEVRELPALRLPPPPADPGPGPALPLALVALTCAGVGLVASQVPYGRFITVTLAALGLLLALGALLLTERGWRIPTAAAALNLLALVLALALPGWLGMTGWLPPKVENDARTVQAVGIDGAAPVPVEWVDASAAAWQLDDMRVNIVSVGVGPVELIGPKKAKKRSKAKALLVRVRVTNAGVARPIDFLGWTVPAPGPQPIDTSSTTGLKPTAPASALGPRLTDAAGQELPPAQFEPGWEPAEKLQLKTLYPGRSAEQVLYFTPPTSTAGPLRLELPGAAFGSPEPARLLIPHTMTSLPR